MRLRPLDRLPACCVFWLVRPALCRCVLCDVRRLACGIVRVWTSRVAVSPSAIVTTENCWDPSPVTCVVAALRVCVQHRLGAALVLSRRPVSEYLDSRSWRGTAAVTTVLPTGIAQQPQSS